ncbi:MAG TPA: CHASE2 domain-containing protein [Vicinamibacteria bacterium]|jgi:CHASE2 domain-containing sensor protein
MLAGLAAASVSLTLYFLDWPLSPIELGLYDANLRWFWVETSPPHEIVIVAIDTPSLKALGPFPWPRKHHAAVIERVARGAAKAIGVDVGFFEPDGDDPRNDELLTQAAADAGNVVFPMVFEEIEDAGRTRARPVLPMARLSEVSAGYGHAHLMFDPDGVIRSAGLSLRSEDVLFWRMDVEVLREFLDLPKSAVRALRPGAIAVGSLEVPVSKPRGGDWASKWPAFEHALAIAYAGPTGTFERVSALDVIEGRFPGDAFRDRLVLYGATAAELGDSYRTPVSRDHDPTPGVEIQANVIHTLLNRRFLRRVGPVPTVVLTLLGSVAVGVGRGRWRAWRGFEVPLTLLLLFGAFYLLAFNVFGYWVEVAPVLVAVVLGFAATVYRRREFFDRIGAC